MFCLSLWVTYPNGFIFFGFYVISHDLNDFNHGNTQVRMTIWEDRQLFPSLFKLLLNVDACVLVTLSNQFVLKYALK